METAYAIMTLSMQAAGCIFLFGVLIILPLAVIPRIRPYAAQALLVVSYLLGLCLWLSCAALVYLKWGWVVLIVSILFFGIGPLVLAIVIELIDFEWMGLLTLVLMAVAIYSARFGALQMRGEI